ncbi:MAG: hypothetical protein Q8O24_08085 [Gallionellaceae bacterium]|nr:hypothetical protein [Gallionellaceae bacterium]
MPKICKPEYLAKVAKLSKLEKERLMSRMSGKLPRRLEKDKLNNEEALAFQLELEDEQLQEWRKMMAIIREKEAVKLKAQQAKEVKKAPKAKQVESKQKVKIEDIKPVKNEKPAKKKAKK